MSVTRARCRPALPVDKYKYILETAATLKMMHSSQIVPGSLINSATDRESARDIIQVVNTDNVCLVCFKMDSKEARFKLCSRCLAKYYCSRECQTRDWPAHKELCERLEKAKRHQRFVNKLLDNHDFRVFLQVAIILSLDLLKASWKRHLAFPSKCSPKKRGSSQSKCQKSKKLMQGLSECREHQYHSSLSLWGGIAHVQEYPLNRVNSVQIPKVLDPMAVLIAHRAPAFEKTILATGSSCSEALSVKSCLEYINTTIILDKDNKLLLRGDMKAQDKELIRDSAGPPRPDKDGIAVAFMRSKMENENAYKALLGRTDIFL